MIQSIFIILCIIIGSISGKISSDAIVISISIALLLLGISLEISSLKNSIIEAIKNTRDNDKE